MKVNALLKEVLSGIKPGKGKRKDVELMLKSINSSLKKNKIKAKAVIGGSFAKDTFLKEDHDVDIFVLFSQSYGNEGLSEMLEKALKGLKGMKHERIHGSRDYFRIKNDLNYEIVPVLEIKKGEDAKNVTDFSPMHVKWVNKNGKKYKDDIRLAKKFCKAAKVYGAESYINGFSGHVLDILVVYYKGFLGFAKEAAKWKEKKIIDFYNAHKGKALFNLNKSKTAGPLVVVDPVQPDRNAAAAVTKEKFGLLVKAARNFIKKPSADFFDVSGISVEELKKKGALIVKAEAVKAKEDVAGTKLLKAFDFLKKQLADFGIKKAGWEWDKEKKAVFWLIVEKKKLSETEERAGPPVSKEKFAKDFRKKYKKVYARKGRLYAKVKRKNTLPKSALKDALKEKYFSERAKRAKIL